LLHKLPFKKHHLTGTAKNMTIFSKIGFTLCSGSDDSQCAYYLEKKHLNAAERICPACGSEVVKVKVVDKLVVLMTTILSIVTGVFLYVLMFRLFTQAPGQTPSPAAASQTPSPAAASQTPSPAAASQTPSPAAASQTPSPAAASQTPFPSSLPSPEFSQPPLPTVEQIRQAIAKLETENPNDLIGFPVDGDERFLVIAYIENERAIRWTVKSVKEFLESSLKNGGKFPDGETIRLIVIRKDDPGKRLMLKPLNRNQRLGHIVRSLNQDNREVSQ